MPKISRPQLTYANVMSTLAVFLLLGGGAYAATKLPKNSVGTKQLKTNAVTGAKVKDHSLTGTDIDASTLGTVPNAGHADSAAHADAATRADSAAHADSAGDATTLQGSGPSAFIHGGGTVVQGRVDLNVGASDAAVLALPGLGSISVNCQAGPLASVFLHNTTGETIDVATETSGTTTASTIAAGSALNFGSTVGSLWQIQVARRASPSTLATISLTTSFSGPTACTVFAQATISS